MNKRTKYYLLFLLLLFIIYLYNNHNINEYYNDDNYIANGLFYSPQTEIKEFTKDKFADLEVGLNQLMNKYKK